MCASQGQHFIVYMALFVRKKKEKQQSREGKSTKSVTFTYMHTS